MIQQSIEAFTVKYSLNESEKSTFINLICGYLVKTNTLTELRTFGNSIDKIKEIRNFRKDFDLNQYTLKILI